LAIVRCGGRTNGQKKFARKRGAQHANKKKAKGARLRAAKKGFILFRGGELRRRKTFMRC